MFGLVERFIGAKMLEISRDHWFGDQVALEALVRFTDEELKHQELFRRIEALAAEGMPDGYRVRCPSPTTWPRRCWARRTWAVLALTCHIELFTQVHYRSEHRARRGALADLYKDVFLLPLEGGVAARDPRRAGVGARGRRARRRGARSRRGRPDRAGRRGRRHPAAAGACGQPLLPAPDRRAARAGRGERAAARVLQAYRWQYIVSGVQEPRFDATLRRLVTPEQAQRIARAIAPLCV